MPSLSRAFHSVAHKHRKPHIARDGGPVSPAQALLTFIQDNKIKVLNVAGPLASKEPEVSAFVQEVLEELSLAP